MASGYCQICINHSLLPDFLFFQCGHGFCTSCIESLFRGRRKTACPNCRVPVTRRDARAIFFDVIDPKISAVVTVIDGLSKMDEGSKLVSVKKAEEKIRRAAENLEVGEDTADMLLQAVNQFKERIIPAFTKVEAQMEEIVSLRKDLDVAWREKEQVATRYRKARKVEMDVQRMRESVAQVSGERDKALLLAEQACQETVKLREAKEASTSTIAVLEEENERYRGQLQRHMELERTRKDKISRMKQEILDLREALHSKESNNAVFPSVQVHDIYPSTQDILMPARTVNTPKPISAHVTRVNTARHDFEGIPPPGFASGWQIEAPNSKKRKHPATDSWGSIKSNGFPIGLDRGGQPTKAVQLGPKKSLRAAPGLK